MVVDTKEKLEEALSKVGIIGENGLTQMNMDLAGITSLMLAEQR